MPALKPPGVNTSRQYKYRGFIASQLPKIICVDFNQVPLNCYKLIVTQDRFGSHSSRMVIIKLMREIHKKLHKIPNSEIGVMFIETEVFPKEYYLITPNNAILNAIKADVILEETNYPPTFDKGTLEFTYLGNPDFFPRNV